MRAKITFSQIHALEGKKPQDLERFRNVLSLLEEVAYQTHPSRPAQLSSNPGFEHLLAQSRTEDLLAAHLS